MNLTLIFILSGVIRYSLSVSKYSSLIQHSIEVSTPLNSLKRGEKLKISIEEFF